MDVQALKLLGETGGSGSREAGPARTLRCEMSRQRSPITRPAADEPSTRARGTAVARKARDASEAEQAKQVAAQAQQDLVAARRRFERQASEAELNATAALVFELLPVIDDFERALQAAGVSPAALEADDAGVHGFLLIYRNFEQVLARFGVEIYDPAGEPFDPAGQEAVAVAQPGTHAQAAGTVTQTYSRGYRLGAKVLRPARVVVAG